MTFYELFEAYQRGELLLIDGAMARIYLRKDGICRIQEIFSLKPGQGRAMVELIKTKAINSRPGDPLVRASCPSTLESITFWPKVGFTETRRYTTPRGNEIVEFEWRPA